MQTFNSSAPGADPLAAIDLRITLARKRLPRLETERSRALFHAMDCLARGVMPGPTGKRLVGKLDEYIAAAEQRLRELEAERQQALLRCLSAIDATESGSIDALAGVDE